MYTVWEDRSKAIGWLLLVRIQHPLPRLRREAARLLLSVISLLLGVLNKARSAISPTFRLNFDNEVLVI